MELLQGPECCQKPRESTRKSDIIFASGNSITKLRLWHGVVWCNRCSASLAKALPKPEAILPEACLYAQI